MTTKMHARAGVRGHEPEDDQMETVTELITPELAREYLDQNTSENRKIRPRWVDILAARMKRGEWILSAQGIAFDSDGKLIDGQHRLLAIEKAGVAAIMRVTRNAPPGSYGVQDRGLKRSLSDALQRPAPLVAVGAFIAQVDLGDKSAISDSITEEYIDFVEPYYEQLLGWTQTVARYWGSAPFRAAAILQMAHLNDDSYVGPVYRALCLHTYKDMPPVAEAINRQAESGMIRARQPWDLFARGMRVFDPSRREATKLQVAGHAPAVDLARRILDAKMKTPRRVALAAKRRAQANGGRA